MDHFDLAGIPTVDLERVRAVFPPERSGRESPVETDGAAPSAVLVVFFMSPPMINSPPGIEPTVELTVGSPSDEPQLHVLLTRRSWGLRTHSGEVSFPGGRCEFGETTRDAAAREAWEETALDPALVEALGELDHLTTVTRRAYIVPQVAVVERLPELRANPAEVDQILYVPVAELLRAEVFREEQWGDPGKHRPIYFFDLVGNTVWGATAAMLRQCLAMLVGADPGSLEDLDPARLALDGYRLDPKYQNRVV